MSAISSPYAKMSTEAMIKNFVADCERIGRCSSRTYNQKRANGLPTWECIARRLGTDSWVSVCEQTGVYCVSLTTNREPLVVESYSETDRKIAEIEEKYAKIIEQIWQE